MKTGRVGVHDDGNDYISGFDNRLWNFTYTVLMKFQCPIMFKVLGPDAPRKVHQFINFFVPKGRQDVADYIIQEWQHEVRVESAKFEGVDWFWNTYVNIYFYDGIEPHMEHADVVKMSQNAMLYLYAKLEGKDVEFKDCIPDETKVQ